MSTLFRFALLLVLLFRCGSAAEDAQEEETAEAGGWAHRLELSFVSTTGNTQTRSLAGKLESRGEIGRNRLFFTASLIAQGSDGQETANQSGLNGRIERKLNDRLFALFEIFAERDEFSGYEYRISGGPGLGVDLFEREWIELKTYASAVYYYDRFSVGEISLDSYLGVKFTFDSIFRLQDNLDLKNDFNVFSSTAGQANVLIDNASSLTVKINNYLGIGLSYIIKFDNSPPTAEIEKMNTTFFSSLVVSF